MGSKASKTKVVDVQERKAPEQPPAVVDEAADDVRPFEPNDSASATPSGSPRESKSSNKASVLGGDVGDDAQPSQCTPGEDQPAATQGWKSSLRREDNGTLSELVGPPTEVVRRHQRAVRDLPCQNLWVWILPYNLSLASTAVTSSSDYGLNEPSALLC